MIAAKMAFVVPLDPSRHIQYASNLAALASDFSDVYIVLSRDTDRKLIPEPLDSRVRLLVLTDWITEDALVVAERKRSVPTFKKWVALKYLLDNQDAKNRYEYMVCCDSEVRLLRQIDEDFIKLLRTQFIFVGDHLSDHSSYDSYKLILSETTARVASLKDCRSSCIETIFSWWSGLPIYATQSLAEFLDHIGAGDALTLAKSLKWEVFDHIVYQRYVVSRSLHGALCICLTHDLKTPTGWSLEDVATEAAYIASNGAGLATLWASHKTIGRLPHLAPIVYIEYHLDH